MNFSRGIGLPDNVIRSRMSCRCGEVKRPVRRPLSRRIASIIRLVDVLPLVPVRWIEG